MVKAFEPKETVQCWRSFLAVVCDERNWPDRRLMTFKPPGALGHSRFDR